MSRKSYSRYGTKSRRDREIRQQRRELIDANRIAEKETVVDAPKESKNDDVDIDWIPESKRKWYVLDTNLILSCVDVIVDVNDEKWRPPLNFYPVLDNAHLIIPQKVFDELNKIKDGHTINRPIARKAMDRFIKFFQNSERTIRETLNLERPVRTGWKNQTISLLPLHRNFADPLPYVPDVSDNDGWIALTALAATMIRDGLPVDGTAETRDMLERSNSRHDVVLLTNDKPLLSMANIYAVRTRTYSFSERPPFTGRRDLTVPAEMFERFYYHKILTREEFEKYLPNELPLVANEFIVMTPEYDEYPRGYSPKDRPFANVARYDKGNDRLYPLDYMKKEGIMPPNAGIATYYDAMNNSKIRVIAVSGRAGTGKTYQVIVHAINAIEKKLFKKLVLIINSEDNGVGYLPGDQDQKVAPMVELYKDAIRSYLEQTEKFVEIRKGQSQNNASHDIEEATYDEDDYIYDYPKLDPYDGHSKKKTKKRRGNNGNDRSDASFQIAQRPASRNYDEELDDEVERRFKHDVKVVPFKQALGRNFRDAIIVLDESQRISIDEMITLITRKGHHTLLVVCGDVNQIKHNSPEKRAKNGFVLTQKLYYDWEGCANIYLTDNMRDKAVDIANKNYDVVMEELYGFDT